MEFNKFYFLHIPKAGGHYVKEEIINYVVPALSFKNIESRIGHFYWEPVDDKTYVVSSFRDPVKRTVSHYAWNAIHLDEKKEINVKGMMIWIENNKKYLSNYQSRSILYDLKPSVKSLRLEGDINFLNLDVDDDLLNKRIKRINIFIKDKNLNKKSAFLIKDKIFKDLNLNSYFSPIPSNPLKHNINNISGILYNSLSKEEIEYIESFNTKDLEIYNTDSLFWKDDK